MAAAVVPKRRIPPKAYCDGAVPTSGKSYRLTRCGNAASVTVGDHRELHLCPLHAKAFGVGIPKGVR